MFDERYERFLTKSAERDFVRYVVKSDVVIGENNEGGCAGAKGR